MLWTALKFMETIGAFVIAIKWSVHDHYNGHFLHWCGFVKSSLGSVRFIGIPVKPDQAFLQAKGRFRFRSTYNMTEPYQTVTWDSTEMPTKSSHV